MRFHIKGNPKLDRAGAPVKPANGEPGGGREWMSKDSVDVEVLGVDDIY